MFNICKTIKSAHDTISKVKKDNKIISIIPTMGAIHEAHLSLIEEAKKHSDFIIVTIFVNKKQFNNEQDYKKYPNIIEDDITKLEDSNIDMLFMPDDNEIYSSSFVTKISTESISSFLCGYDRGKVHFDGVCLIITKLFNILSPDIAVFGLKDFQQYFIIKQMTSDLNFNVRIIGIETIREESGLAMSSRNLRLSESKKNLASNIYIILKKIRLDILNCNNSDITSILEDSKKYLLQIGFDRIGYLEIRSCDDFKIIDNISKISNCRIFIAVYIGNVRLIDNLQL